MAQAEQQGKKTAEEWVLLAKKYGEDCVAVQRDSSLSKEEKIAKQEALSNKLLNTVRNDVHLSQKDKKQIEESIHFYFSEWKRLSGVVIS